MHCVPGSVKTNGFFLMALVLSLGYLAVLPAPVAAQHIGVSYVSPTRAEFSALCTVQAGITDYKIYANSVKHGKKLIETYPADGQTRIGMAFLENGVNFTFQMYAVNGSGDEIFEKQTEDFTAGVPKGILNGGDIWNAAEINGGSLVIDDEGALDIQGCTVNNLLVSLSGGANLSIGTLSAFTGTTIRTGSPLISNGEAITVSNCQFTGGEFRLIWDGTGDNFEAKEVTFSGCPLEIVNADQVIVEQSVLNDSESKIQDAKDITITDTHINQSFNASAQTSILMQQCESDEGYSPQITLSTPLGDPVRSTVDVQGCEFRGDGDKDMRFISRALGNFNATHLTLSGGVTLFQGTLIELEHCFVDDSSLSIEGVPDEFGDSFASALNCRFDAGGRDPKTILKGAAHSFENTNFNRMYLYILYKYDTDMGDVELNFENCTFINSTDPEQFFIDQTVPPELEADPLAENYIASWTDGDVTVRDCQFIGGKGGLWKQEGYEVAKGQTILEGCSIDRGTGIGARVSSEEVVLNNNTLTNNGRALMIMHANIATITNNTIDGTTKPDEGNGIDITTVPNLNFYNNTIRNAIGSAAVSISACSSFFEINMLVLEDCEAGLRIGDPTEDSSIEAIQITNSLFKNCGEYSTWLDSFNRPAKFDNCVFEGKSTLHIKTTDYEGATATPVLEIRDCEFRNGEGFVLSDSNRLRHVRLLNNHVHDWSSRSVFDQERITSSLKIEDNIFERVTGGNTAVIAGTSDEIEIRNNQFSECENALYVRNSEDPQIINNRFNGLTGVAINCFRLTRAKINGNAVDTARIGIDLDTVNDSTISNNTMRKCQGPAPLDGDGSGLHSWSASNIFLEDNVSSENIFGYYCGGPDNLRFTTCDAKNNQEAGFHIGYAYDDWWVPHQNCELVNCTVDGNGAAGVVFRPEGEGHVITGGVYKNSPVLIDNQGTTDFGMEHVRLEDAGEIGVKVGGEVTSGRMNGCFLIRCPIGALLDDVQNFEVNRSRFQESGETALHINKGSGHVVIHSQFDNSGHHGVVEQSASNIRYTYASFLDNDGMGLYRKDAAAPGVIEKCTFRSNFLGGLVCEGLDAGTIEKNAFLDNRLDGMRLSGCTNMTITQNKIMRNEDAGLDLGASTGNRIYDNSLRNDKNAIATALNTWNLQPPVDGTNIIGGPKIGGNEWNSYIGEDTSGDGLGDTLTPHTDNGNITTGGDQYPLVYSFISPEKPDHWPLLNEICPPTEDAVPREWVEIANPGAFDQTLGGWQLVFNDGESTFTLPMTGPDWDGVLESKGFLVIHLQGYQNTVGKDIDWPEGANLLAGSGASVVLLDAEGNQRDDVRFGAPDDSLSKPDPGNSLGRDKDSFDMDLPFDWDPNCGYDAETPTPGRANIDITYTLTVNNGTGSGPYEPGEVVNIAADDPAAGSLFDQWTGDTAHVADVNSARTTVTMPESNVTVTATYTGQQVVYVSADGTCNGNTPCYATLGEAVTKAEDDALIKVAGNMAGNTVVDPAGTCYIEFGYDAEFTSNAGGVTKVQGTFTARDKTVIRSGTIRAE
jgi:parallel beta-helix repeat protein